MVPTLTGPRNLLQSSERSERRGHRMSRAVESPCAHRADTLKRLGMTNEQLFEVTTAVTVFAKNAAFSTGLQLEPVTT